VGCRQREAATDLVRLVVVDGRVVVDRYRTLPGRGAHIHPTQECVHLAVTRKALSRAFKETVDAHIVGSEDFTSTVQAPSSTETRA
jgi:predicted RNA-binding protein YlxR (DUF448 family)